MMRATLTVLAALATLASGSCIMPDYDPNDPVTVKVVAPEDLNSYSGGAQKLDLYFSRVSEALTYEGSDVGEFRVTKSVTVPGGRSINRFTVSPDESVPVQLGKMIYEQYTHVVVFAAYGAPSGESGSQVRAAEIPPSGKLVLVLGPNGIVKFEEDD